MPQKRAFSFQTVILLLFYALFFFTPLYFRFITEELFEFNKMILIYCFTTLIATAWGIRMVFEKKILFSRSALDLPLLLFVGVQFLASVLSIHPRTSFLGYYSRFHGGFASTISYVILYYAFISNIKKEQISQLFIAFFSSMSLVSLWGIFEHFGHSLSCVALTSTFDVSCWVQDVQNRVYASLGQPNWMAAFIISVLPVALSQALIKTKHTGEKILLFTTITLGLFGLYYTKSRSGFLGLIGALGSIFLAASVLWLRGKKHTKAVLPQPSALLLSVGLIVGVSTLTGTPYTPKLTDVLTSKYTHVEEVTPAPTQVVNRLDIGGTDSGEIRKIVWQGALDVWKHYPILGSGVETFGYSYYAYRPTEHNLVSEWDFLYNKAHNELLNFLATSGIAGLLTYLLLWIVGGILIIKTLLSTQKITQEHYLLTGLGAGLVALFISNFFGFSTVTISLITFMYFAMIALLTNSIAPSGISKASTQKHAKKNSKKQGASLSQYFIIALIVLAGIIILTQIHNYYRADVHYATGKTLMKAGNYQQGILQMQTAIKRSPKEALFYDTFSVELAKLAVTLAKQEDATAAAQIGQSAIALSDTALSLNDVHLNFYKNRTRMFITLSQLEPTLLEEAQTTLVAALDRAPTDPKLYYNLGVVESSLGNTQAGLKNLEHTIELKPNYPAARLQLGKEYAQLGRGEEARLQFEYILAHIDPTNQAAIEQLQLLEE